MDKLRRELEGKNAEIQKVKSLLQTSEKVLYTFRVNITFKMH